MFATDKFINNLPKDPMQALDQVCDHFFNFHDSEPASGKTIIDYYNEYLEALGLIQALCESHNIEFHRIPFLEGEPIENIESIANFFRNVQTDIKKHRTKIMLQVSKDKFKAKLGAGFVYEFTDGDLARIQTLINELRKEISKSTLFKEAHKERLLKRLEVLQAEIHKKMSSVDKFWGLLGEAGVVLGKFGKDAKPFFDRIKEIAQIVWRTQARVEELESGKESPFLIPDEDKEEE